MINFKTLRKKWIEPTIRFNSVDQKDYKRHFQEAIINLEQNRLEERNPELRKIA